MESVGVPPETDETTENLEHVMVLLFRQRPAAVQKLTQWMEERSKVLYKDVPKVFQRICKRAHEAAQQNLP